VVTLAEGPNAEEDDSRFPPGPAPWCCSTRPGAGHRRHRRGIQASDDEKARRIKLLAAIDRPQKDQPPALFLFGTDDRLLEASRIFAGMRWRWAIAVSCGQPKAKGTSFFNRPPWFAATLRKADEFLVSLGYLLGAPRSRPAPMPC